MKTVTFYTRVGCSLCHTALDVVESVRAEEPFELRIVDLDHQAPKEKLAAYDWEVPVLELDGRKVAKYRIERERLLRLVRE